MKRVGRLMNVPSSVWFFVVWLSIPTYAQQAPYERGNAAPLSCAAEEEDEGGHCYPRCKTGFKGSQEVCWEVCPVTYTDAGSRCLTPAGAFKKKSYDRGAGRSAETCPEGLERDGDACHALCKPGYRGVGRMCEPQ